MPNPEIEEFAKLLVEHVRDLAIKHCDGNLRPISKHPIAQRWREAARDGELESIANEIIPDVVDDTLFCLLLAVDNGILKLSFTASNGEVVDLAKDGLGELAGWYAGTSWTQTYSKQRFVDDNADLK